jgi:hypothetical protein
VNFSAGSNSAAALPSASLLGYIGQYVRQRDVGGRATGNAASGSAGAQIRLDVTPENEQ